MKKNDIVVWFLRIIGVLIIAVFLYYIIYPISEIQKKVDDTVRIQKNIDLQQSEILENLNTHWTINKHPESPKDTLVETGFRISARFAIKTSETSASFFYVPAMEDGIYNYFSIPKKIHEFLKDERLKNKVSLEIRIETSSKEAWIADRGKIIYLEPETVYPKGNFDYIEVNDDFSVYTMFNVNEFELKYSRLSFDEAEEKTLKVFQDYFPMWKSN